MPETHLEISVPLRTCPDSQSHVLILPSADQQLRLVRSCASRGFFVSDFEGKEVLWPPYAARGGTPSELLVFLRLGPRFPSDWARLGTTSSAATRRVMAPRSVPR